MSRLHKYFLDNPGKQIRKWGHYFSIYERHFGRFRGESERPIVMLEIGVQAGGSLQMWKEYFGKNSVILGIDINPECKIHDDDDIEVFIGSQDDPALIDSIFSFYDIDIVLDDGSHKMDHMIKSFELIYHRMEPDGIYMVEDTHTCYSPAHGGGLNNENSFIEFSKKKIDELHGAYETQLYTDFTRSTGQIVFYDSIIVFERQPQTARQGMFSVGMSERHKTVTKDDMQY